MRLEEIKTELIKVIVEISIKDSFFIRMYLDRKVSDNVYYVNLFAPYFEMPPSKIALTNKFGLKVCKSSIPSPTPIYFTGIFNLLQI